MIKVTVHEELLPHGVTVEEIYEAITVENVEPGNDPGGLDTLIDAVVDGLSDTILDQQVNTIDANIDLRGQIATLEAKVARAKRAFKVANQQRHHAIGRADDLAVQRNSWCDGFQDMQRKRNQAETERDAARAAANAATEAANVAFKLSDTMAVENARLQGLLAAVAGRLDGAAALKYDDVLAGMLDEVNWVLTSIPFTDETASDHAHGGLEPLSAKGEG